MRNAIAAVEGTCDDREEELVKVLRNTKLGAARAVAAALVEVFHTELPVSVERLPDQLANRAACYRVPIDRLVEITGLSPHTIGRQTATLASYTMPNGAPVLHREVIFVHNYGAASDVVNVHKELWVGPGMDPAAFGAVLSNLDPIERKPWGGHRE